MAGSGMSMSDRRFTVATMGWLALAIAVIGAVAAALPGSGMFVAMGLGIFAIGAGAVGYRRGQDPGWSRLAGAGGIALGVLAVGLAFTRYGVTLAAVRRLESLFA